MAERIDKVLSGKNFNEPPEIAIIKRFIKDKFHADASVTITDNQVIIGVNGAALAGTLRMHLHELEKLCPNSKRLIIKII